MDVQTLFPTTGEQPSAALLASKYLNQGISVIPIQHRSKAPLLRDWPKVRLSKAELDAYFSNHPMNIGGVLGNASGGMVDIDFDWLEAAQLAPKLLPKSWAFGRKDNGRFLLRHLLIRCKGIDNNSFNAPLSLVAKDTSSIIEILSTGRQVVLPGSTHPNGSLIEWLYKPSDVELAELTPDALRNKVQQIAGCALLSRLWSALEGERHNVSLALAGTLHHSGWQHTDIEAMLIALLHVVDDCETKDRARAISDTLQSAKEGGEVTGLPRLAELLGSDVTDCLVRWWGLGNNSVQLTFNGKPIEVASDTTSNSGCQRGQGPGVTQNNDLNDWPELLEFESDHYEGNTREYPIEALGPVIGPAVTVLKDTQQVPTALAAQSLLSAAASTVQQYYDVIIDNRRIPLSLWLALVAEPGERKTSTDTIAFSRLFQRQREAEQRYIVALEGWKTAKATKDTEPGPKPRKPSWLLSDCTTEGLIKTLDRHWPALTLTNSDAGAWLAGYSMREGRDSATAAVLSQLWSGAAHSMARASLDEPVALINRRLSLSLMLQPTLAAQLFESTTLAGQGFLSRCLPAFPVSTIGTRFYTATPDDGPLTTFFEVQDDLLRRQPEINLETGELSPTPLALTHEAKAGWIQCHDNYEAALVDDYKDIREVANKAPEQVLRLAGIMAVMEGCADVQKSHIDNAVALMDYYLNEFQSMAVKLVAHRRDIALPKQLLEWMQKRCLETGEDTFNLRDIYKAGPRFIRNQAQLSRDLMMELIRRGYVRLWGKDYQVRPDHED